MDVGYTTRDRPLAGGECSCFGVSIISPFASSNALRVILPRSACPRSNRGDISVSFLYNPPLLDGLLDRILCMFGVFIESLSEYVRTLIAQRNEDTVPRDEYDSLQAEHENL